MRHLKRGRKLNRTRSHRLAMLSNMASSLVFYKRIRTTLPKAKTLSPFVERLVTYSKHNDKLHGRRLILSKIIGKNSKQVANVLMDEIETSGLEILDQTNDLMISNLNLNSDLVALSIED